MRVIFAGGNGYIPEFNGGVQSSTDHLVRQCLAAGHDAAVLAALFGEGRFGFAARLKLKLLRSPVATDTTLGYPVMRAWYPWDAVSYAVRNFRPDVAVVQCHKAVKVGKALAAEGVPLVVYLRNVEYTELEGDPRDLTGALFIANSRFTAMSYARKFGIESVVIPPTIDARKYAYDTTREFVTFINVDPKKGFERAVGVARRCPDIPFLFVEGWTPSSEHLAKVKATLADLSNVTFKSQTNDMGEVYGRTKILLAPSKWEEAWGRVASEAHCSGIPVIGSSRGGLPEAIGPGGRIIDYDASVEEWTAAVREYWDDAAAYEAASQDAHTFAGRPELNVERQFTTFMSVLERALEGAVGSEAD